MDSNFQFSARLAQAGMALSHLQGRKVQGAKTALYEAVSSYDTVMKVL